MNINHLIDQQLTGVLFDLYERIKKLEQNQLTREDIQKEIKAFDRLHNKE